MKFLDENGLLYFWNIIKDKLSKAGGGLLNESVIGWNGEEIPEGYEEVENPNNEIFNAIYPIGRGFIDFTGTDFTNYLGFKWERELVGMFPVGYNPNDTSFDSIGEKGGEKEHILTTNEMPAHTHTQNAHSHIQQIETGNGGIVPLVTKNTGGSTSSDCRANQEQWKAGTPITTQTTTATNQNTGGGQAHNNLPPYQVVAYWKRIA